MKQVLLAFVPVLAMVAVTGCSGNSSTSPFGADPDFASIQARMDKPDGTFNGSSSVFDQFNSAQSGANSANIAGAPGTSSSSSGGSSTSTASYRSHSTALRLLDDTQSGLSSSCSAMQHGDLTGSCACPGGGNFSYDFSEYQAAAKTSGITDVTLRVAMSQCVSTNNDMVDGHEFVHLHQDTSKGSVPDDSALIVVDVTARTAGVTHSLDANMLLATNASGSSVSIAVQVDDGWIVVQANASADGTSGSYGVRDKNGTWTCSVSNGAGSCTGTNGQVQQVKP
jgi:hypothetical protein